MTILILQYLGPIVSDIVSHFKRQQLLNKIITQCPAKSSSRQSFLPSTHISFKLSFMGCIFSLELSWFYPKQFKCIWEFRKCSISFPWLHFSLLIVNLKFRHIVCQRHFEYLWVYANEKSQKGICFNKSPTFIYVINYFFKDYNYNKFRLF